MAIISTLRNKMTKWVVGLVSLAIVSFVLSDLFGNGPRSLFGGSDDTVGKINGVRISVEDYENAIQDQKNYYVINLGRQPSESEMDAVRERAWERLVLRYALEPQYKALGIAVTDDEEWDMVQGKHINPSIKQSFTDSTGNFDHARLIDYLKNLRSEPANSEVRIRWTLFRRDLATARLQEKFDNLLYKTVYVTEAEAQQAQHMEDDVASLDYLYVPFSSVADSAAAVSDEDLKNYYERHKEEYKTDETRDLSYVLFPVTPSAADSAAVRESLVKLIPDFESSKEDSLFASINSDRPNAPLEYTISILPQSLAERADEIAPGKVIGPFEESSSYRLAKALSVSSGPAFFARASHILVKAGNDPEAARAKAEKIFKDIRGGKDFAASAREFSEDGSAASGGDLGWFSEGQMVKPFEEAVLGARRTGLVDRVVKTPFGYHIIKVTHIKSNATYKLALIEREILAGDETRSEAYRKAELFESEAKGSLEAFNSAAQKQGLLVRTAEAISGKTHDINSLESSRQIINWLFRTAKEGRVSDIFDLGKDYIIAAMTGKTTEGYKPMDKVKEAVTQKAHNENKATLIQKKLSTLKGSLDEVATAYGAGAERASVDDVKMITGSLPSIGFDPILIGSAFALKSGERSAPLAGERGVALIEMKNKEEAQRIGDYTALKNSILQRRGAEERAKIMSAIEEVVDIEDQRHLFY